MRFFILGTLLACGVLLPVANIQAAAPTADITTDQLLELKLAQAEALDSVDAEVETTVSAEDGVSHTVRTRFGINKEENSFRIARLDQPGAPSVEMKVDGAKVTFRQGNDAWQTVTLEGPVLETLQAMGVDTSPTSLMKPKRLPKEPKARRNAKRQRVKDGLAAWRKAGRQERRADLDGNASAELHQGLDLSQPLAFEQQGLHSDQASSAGVARPRGGRLRAMMSYFNEKNGRAVSVAQRKHPHDAVLELVDEDTGVLVETSRFVATDALALVTGIDESLPQDTKKGGRRIPAWAKRMKAADGRELVEVQRLKVLRQALVKGVVVPAETESLDVTGVGVVGQRVMWRDVKVNE